MAAKPMAMPMAKKPMMKKPMRHMVMHHYHKGMMSSGDQMTNQLNQQELQRIQGGGAPMPPSGGMAPMPPGGGMSAPPPPPR